VYQRLPQPAQASPPRVTMDGAGLRSPAVVVRAPRTGELHGLAPGEEPPTGLAAGMRLLCSGHGIEVPVVRPYAGEFDERRACRTCLAVARGEPPARYFAVHCAACGAARAFTHGPDGAPVVVWARRRR
jgi:hypothetical protein